MEHSHIFSGNTSRLQAVFNKARRGESISIVFLGSSITLGYLIETRHQFTTMITEYFRDTFHNDNITGHNLSVPGMPSLHGLHLAYSEVEQYSPDIIWIDYSVNDQKNRVFRDAYEGLLRKCLSLPSQPAVLSFFVKKEMGYTCAPQMAAVCEYYGVPYVNIGTWLEEDIERGIMRWRDFSYDGCHPGPVGHGYIGRCLLRAMEQLSHGPSMTPAPIPTQGFYNNRLADLHFHPASWENAPTDHSAPLELDADCTTLFLSYLVNTTEDYGTACLYVDGEPFHYLDAYRIHEWEHPVYEVIYLSKEKEMHHLSLEMQKGENNKRFRLLCLGIV